MPRYYYGTVPVLAWILNHYFYGGLHYAWLAGEFFPLRTNPNSSNPYVIYGQPYAAWAWLDEHDKVVRQLRKDLQAGVEAHCAAGTLDSSLADRLFSICDEVSVAFFYPVVYRVALERIPPARRIIAGSGLEGSDEFLVRDMSEGEFELLFADNIRDADFRRFVGAVRQGSGTSDALLHILEGR